MQESPRGLAYGVTAYGLWGLFPLYWSALGQASALEILGHRIAWSMVTMTLVVILFRRTAQLRATFASRRARRLLLVASLVIAANWGGFIYGVNADRVVEVALGYFINPLVTVLMGVAFLRERLRRWQWAAMGVAGLAVVVLAVDYGGLPWVALVLAFSFGTYGLMKKFAGVDAVESLTFETLVLAPVAIAYLVWLGQRGEGTFTSGGTGHALLLASTGLVTAIPLLCFGAAALRIPMTMLGLLQYIAPTLHFALGLWVFREPMSGVRWVGFLLVWGALAIFTVEAYRHRRRQLRLAAEAAAL